MSQIEVVVSKATRTSTYNTSNARCKLNYIKYKYELVSLKEKMKLSRTQVPKISVRSEWKRVCVCAEIANKADERDTFQGAAEQVKVTFRCICVCVCVVLLESIG